MTEPLRLSPMPFFDTVGKRVKRHTTLSTYLVTTGKRSLNSCGLFDDTDGREARLFQIGCDKPASDRPNLLQADSWPASDGARIRPCVAASCQAAFHTGL